LEDETERDVAAYIPWTLEDECFAESRWIRKHGASRAATSQ